jgi:dolichol-phosphate mannosyltransferase
VENPGRGLSVIIPAYNEEETLKEVATKTLQVLNKTTNDFEIVIVDDGSLDNTRTIADMLEKKYRRIKVTHHSTNKGYGVALKTGISLVRYSNVIVIPADGQFPPSDIEKFIPLMGKTDFILGFRKERKDSLTRRFNAKLFHLFLYFFFKCKLRDVNWIKLYNKDILDSIDIKSDGIAADAEIVIKLLDKKCEFKEVGVGYARRRAGKASSLNIKHIFQTIFELISLRLKW